ncbi:MAG: hypothetical protein ACYDAP_03605 [Thermoplasmataceae archaeon]
MIISQQIYWLRQLSTASRDEIKVMPKPMTTWVTLYDVITKYPQKPIHSRTIMRNEIVLEIDNPDWATVRDGTRRIIGLLEKWNAKDSYYLSFSGNNSIHVHLFMDLKTIEIFPETSKIIGSQEGVVTAVKKWIMTQFEIGASTILDKQLSGTHMIRLEGGFNEKSKKFCTQIDAVPVDKPNYYDIQIPKEMPSNLWNLSSWSGYINKFLLDHFKPRESYITGDGRPISTKDIPAILKPVFIPGHRHAMVMALTGWLKRHGISESDALRIVREIHPHDKTPSKTNATIHDIFVAPETARVPGLPKLISIIRDEMTHGEISHVVGEDATRALDMIMTEEVIEK